MLRITCVAGLLIVMLPSSPSLALTAKQKMETCKFGADDQKLQGGARKTFLSRCMAKGDTPDKKAAPAKKPEKPAS